MDKVNQSSRLIAGRKRKMMLALPVLIIPFLTLAFWAMGGGKGDNKQTEKNSTGLNLHLPDPKVKKETIFDKLGFYDKADKDSIKLKEAMRNDPYYQQQEKDGSSELENIVQQSANKFHQSSLNTSPYTTNSSQAEAKLMQKLSELNNAINQPQIKQVRTEGYPDISASPESDVRSNGNVERMENMIESMSQSNDGDTELRQLSSMMDKILDIQHPQRIKEQLKGKIAQQNENIFSVTGKADDDTIANGFYGLENETPVQQNNTIEAVVNENQTLVNGAIIRLRLISDLYIKNVKIPAGNFINGIVSLDGERLEVEIHSIRTDNSIYPVKMEVYDMDGLPGIYIPGAIGRDVAKQSADNGLQTMQLAALDPSLAGQVTAAGIGTIKNLISKKVKLVKVMVKAGYKVLLVDKSQR